jgi:DNA-binding transcriptional LysR family regulator
MQAGVGAYHSMRQLEERIVIHLPTRTTRSVSLTDAGVRLLQRRLACQFLARWMRGRKSADIDKKLKLNI